MAQILFLGRLKTSQTVTPMYLFAGSLCFLRVTRCVKYSKVPLDIKNLVLPRCDSLSPLFCYMQQGVKHLPLAAIAVNVTPRVWAIPGLCLEQGGRQCMVCLNFLHPPQSPAGALFPILLAKEAQDQCF